VVYSMVRAFLGQPGSGKTYMMSGLAEEWARRNPGRTVFTTYDLMWPDDGRARAQLQPVWPPYEGMPSIVEARDGLLLIDEAALTFDSRMFQSTPIELLHKLMQIRKYKLELWWSTQHLEYVDKRLRLLTFESFHCGSAARLPWPFACFFATVRHGVHGRFQTGRVFRRSPFRDRLYDTNEIVARAAYMDRKGKVRSQPEAASPGSPG